MPILVLILTVLNSWTLMANDLVLTQGDLLTLPGPLIIESKELFKSSMTANGTSKLMAIKSGVTRVKSRSNWFTIQIVSPSQRLTFEKIKSVLPKTLGLKIKYENAFPSVYGHLLRIEDWQTLADACETHCQYKMMAKIPKPLFSKAHKYFSILLNSNGLSIQPINFEKPWVFFVPKGLDKTLDYGTILRPYGVHVKENIFAIEARPMIQVTITLAEIKKESFSRYGIQWPSQVELNVGRPQIAADSLLVNLHALESNGDGKILAQPNLVAKSGQTAEFFAGGEFPIRVLSGKYSAVTWKPYGLKMEVKPTTDHTGLVSIELVAEMSSLDMSKSVDGIPALFNHKVRSKFDVNHGQTMALSGLIRSEEGRNLAGLPEVSKIPILGSLFSSRDYRNNRSELIVLVKPEIVFSENGSSL